METKAKREGSLTERERLLMLSAPARPEVPFILDILFKRPPTKEHWELAEKETEKLRQAE